MNHKKCIKILITVIIVFVLIFLIYSTFVIISQRNTSKVDNKIKQTFIHASKKYVNEHLTDFKKPDRESLYNYMLSIQTLKDEGYIDKNIYYANCEVMNDYIMVIANKAKYSYKYFEVKDKKLDCKN